MDLPQKLQLAAQQRLVLVDAPEALAAALGPRTAEQLEEPGALLVFVADAAALQRHRTTIVRSAAEDRLTWVAYPKAGQLGTDLNRDRLAALLTTDPVRPVRQVALDEVWSALRFRPA